MSYSLAADECGKLDLDFFDNIGNIIRKKTCAHSVMPFQTISNCWNCFFKEPSLMTISNKLHIRINPLFTYKHNLVHYIVLCHVLCLLVKTICQQYGLPYDTWESMNYFCVQLFKQYMRFLSDNVTNVIKKVLINHSTRRKSTCPTWWHDHHTCRHQPRYSVLVVYSNRIKRDLVIRISSITIKFN